jgi:hypothetical protein
MIDVLKHMEDAKWASVIVALGTLILSLWGFISTRRKEARTRQIEASAPFLQARQSLYTETIKIAAILANPDTHTDELTAAKERFRDLYVAELSMVESPGVEAKMVALAAQVDPALIPLTPVRAAVYELAHALRDASVVSWDVRQSRTWWRRLFHA